MIRSFSGCPGEHKVLWNSTRQTSWSAISKRPWLKSSNQISEDNCVGEENGTDRAGTKRWGNSVQCIYL